MSQSSQSPVQPTRDQRATLGALVDVLLNKGVYLDVDLIITVADIPLIGVNLRATIAGMETMLEYGMMQGWDERTRASVRQSVARHLPLRSGEDVLATMAGGLNEAGAEQGPAIWRLGTVLVTTQRLMVFRREPPEILWEAPRSDVATVTKKSEPSAGRSERTRVEVRLASGQEVVLQAARPEQLVSVLGSRNGIATATASRGRPGPPPRELDLEDASPEGQLLTSDLLFQETRAGSPVWRRGAAVYNVATGFTWKAAEDRRPAVQLTPREITRVRTEDQPDQETNGRILVIESSGGTVRLTGDRIAEWAQVLAEATGAAPG